MKKPRLDPLLRRAEERKTQCTLELAERRRTLDNHIERLNELKRYTQNYAHPAPGALVPALLANHLAFRARIEGALGAQNQTVEQVRSHCEVEVARLLLASRESKILERLAVSYRNLELRVEQRRDQHELDEIANRGYHGKTPEEF